MYNGLKIYYYILFHYFKTFFTINVLSLFKKEGGETALRDCK